MAFIVGTKICCALKDNFKEEQIVKYAPILDVITGVVLLLLGILAINGIITMSLAAGWALVGAGSAYSVIMLCAMLAKVTNDFLPVSTPEPIHPEKLKVEAVD